MPTIILCSLDKSLYEAWNEHCGHLDMVETYLGNILDVQCDAVVSPANSFGFMDGGLDMVYSRYFGWDVQERLQNSIRTNHHGELIVGTAEIVETDAVKIPYLIAAPTMRVPMILTNTVHPYLAARAALLLVKHGTFKETPRVPISQLVHRIAIPGLGTGVGEVPPDICAKQVRAAIEEVVLGNHTFPYSWDDASNRHQLLYRDHVTDLQFEDG